MLLDGIRPDLIPSALWKSRNEAPGDGLRGQSPLTCSSAGPAGHMGAGNAPEVDVLRALGHYSDSFTPGTVDGLQSEVQRMLGQRSVAPAPASGSGIHDDVLRALGQHSAQSPPLGPFSPPLMPDVLGADSDRFSVDLRTSELSGFSSGMGGQRLASAPLDTQVDPDGFYTGPELDVPRELRPTFLPPLRKELQQLGVEQDNPKAEVGIGDFHDRDGKRTYGITGGIHTMKDSWRGKLDLDANPKGPVIEGGVEVTGPDANAGIAVNDSTAHMGMQASYISAAAELGTSGFGSRDRSLRLGASHGPGADFRFHYGDKDNDGKREFGGGIDWDFISGDFKTEDPVGDILNFWALLTYPWVTQAEEAEDRGRRA